MFVVFRIEKKTRKKSVEGGKLSLATLVSSFSSFLVHVAILFCLPAAAANAAAAAAAASAFFAAAATAARSFRRRRSISAASSSSASSSSHSARNSARSLLSDA